MYGGAYAICIGADVASINAGFATREMVFLPRADLMPDSWISDNLPPMCKGFKEMMDNWPLHMAEGMLTVVIKVRTCQRNVASQPQPCIHADHPTCLPLPWLLPAAQLQDSCKGQGIPEGAQQP